MAAAAGLSDLARYALDQRRKRQQAGGGAEAEAEASGGVAVGSTCDDGNVESAGMNEAKDSEEEDAADHPDAAAAPNTAALGADAVFLIPEAGGISALAALLSSGTNSAARENAAGALMHLAVDRRNREPIIRRNGIALFVSVIDDGTPMAHKYATACLLDLTEASPDSQAQTAKHLVGLFTPKHSAGAHARGSDLLTLISSNHPGSTVIMVNAGAISPLVTLMGSDALAVKEQAARALTALSLNSPSTQLAVASGLVGLLGAGTAETQEHVSALLVDLADDKECADAIVKAGAVPRLVVQLVGTAATSVRAQELAAIIMSHLSLSSDAIVAKIAAASSIRPLVILLASLSPIAHVHCCRVLSELARVDAPSPLGSKAESSKSAILAEGGVGLLSSLLEQSLPAPLSYDYPTGWMENTPEVKFEAAGVCCVQRSSHRETSQPFSAS